MMHQRAQRHVFDHRQVAVGLRNLKGPRQTGPGRLIRLPAGDRAAMEVNLARCRRDGAGDQVVKRALAGTVGSDQADQLALADREAHVIDSLERAE